MIRSASASSLGGCDKKEGGASLWADVLKRIVLVDRDIEAV